MSQTVAKFEDCTFGKLVQNLRLESYIKSLNRYNEELSKLIKSDHSYPLFLDTNVLLRYYETSLKSRSQLLGYFKGRLSKIVLTHTVQIEYIRNREGVIGRFITQSLNNFKRDYEKEFVNGLDSYHNKIKSYLDDFPEIGKSIEEIQAKVKDIYQQLGEKIDGIKDKLKELKQNDEYLDLFLNVQLPHGLDESEVKVLKNQFDYLGKELDSVKNDRENKTAAIFPGYLDKKRKGKNPYGDYIIFHEILDYMKTNNADAIFLTFDAKGDWLKESGEAHNHYVQIAFEATGKNLFILDAERYFEINLKTNFAPVTSLEELMQKEVSKLSPEENLRLFVNDIKILIDQILRLYNISVEHTADYITKVTALHSKNVIDTRLAFEVSLSLGLETSIKEFREMRGTNEFVLSTVKKLFAIYEKKEEEEKQGPNY